MDWQQIIAETLVEPHRHLVSDGLTDRLVECYRTDCEAQDD